MKSEIIKDMKNALMGNNNSIMVSVSTHCGDTYDIVYNESCDTVEVWVVDGPGQTPYNPSTICISAEYFTEDELTRILEAIKRV